MPSQWITCGRLTWAFSRDVSFGVGPPSYHKLISPERSPVLQLLERYPPQIPISSAHHASFRRILHYLWAPLHGKHPSLQLHHHHGCSCGEHLVRGARRYHVLSGPREKIAQPATFQSWQVWLLLQWMGSSLDHHHWYLHLLPEHVACQRSLDELVSSNLIRYVLCLLFIDFTVVSALSWDLWG